MTQELTNATYETYLMVNHSIRIQESLDNNVMALIRVIYLVSHKHICIGSSKLLKVKEVGMDLDIA